jgi:hypothetical protein
VYAVPATLFRVALRTFHEVAGALLACGLSAAPAQAQLNRTFVSGKGSFAWNKLVEMPWKIISIVTREWAYRS